MSQEGQVFLTIASKTIRSKRRSLALQVDEDGALIVRAPKNLSASAIEAFIREKQAWIERKVRLMAERAKTAPKVFSSTEEKEMRRLAKDAFIERCCHYAAKMKVSFGKIRLSSAKRRWGSCTARGDLNFHWRLVLAPPEILDYVVVHELTHLVERNHSPRFWAKVESQFPAYKTAKKWLKENRF